MTRTGTGDEDKNIGTGKAEVGEIDTRAPFQSVRAAVSLFVGVALSSKDKRNMPTTTHKSTLSSENALNKETQLLLAQTQLQKYKLQLQTAEAAKARATSEFDKAKITLNGLTTELQSVNQAKLSAIGLAEAVKEQAKQLEVEKCQQFSVDAARKQQLDQEKEQCMIAVTRLDAAKQQLTKLRQDFDAALDSKLASFQRAAEAQRFTNVSTERVDELVKQISAMKESNQQLKLASAQTQQKAAGILAEKDGYIQACKTAKGKMDKNLESLRKQYDPEMTRNLEVKLLQTTVGIEALQEEMRKARNLETSAVKFITTELNEATKMLQAVVEQESLLRDIVTSLKLELEEVRKEKIELQTKEVKGLSEEQRSMLEKILTETEMAKGGLEEINESFRKVKQEAEKSRLMVEEGKKKLQIVVAMVDQAKEREKRANDEMKLVSQIQNHDNKDPHDHKTMKMSLQDFEILKKKVEECDSIAEAKETDAINEVKAIIERKKVAENKIEENLKAMEEIKEATQRAWKSAEMAEAEQNGMEAELRRWRQKDPGTGP